MKAQIQVSCDKIEAQVNHDQVRCISESKLRFIAWIVWYIDHPFSGKKHLVLSGVKTIKLSIITLYSESFKYIFDV